MPVGDGYPTILPGKLDNYLADVGEQAETRYNTTLYKYKRHGIPEQLKTENHMRWIQTMNLARTRAEQNVLNRLIYT